MSMCIRWKIIAVDHDGTSETSSTNLAKNEAYVNNRAAAAAAEGGVMRLQVREGERTTGLVGHVDARERRTQRRGLRRCARGHR